MAGCRRSLRENKGKKKQWDVDPTTPIKLPTPKTPSPKHKLEGECISGIGQECSSSSASPPTAGATNAIPQAGDHNACTSMWSRAQPGSVKFGSLQHQSGIFTCQSSTSPQQAQPSRAVGNHQRHPAQTDLRSNVSEYDEQRRYQTAQILLELASQPRPRRDERSPTPSRRAAAQALLQLGQHVTRKPSPASTVEWDVAGSDDYDTQAGLEGAFLTQNHITSPADSRPQRPQDRFGVMARFSEGLQPAAARPQRELLCVAPSAEGSKSKTKEGQDIDASFIKHNADLEENVGPQPSVEASKATHERYVHDSMAHLVARAEKRNEWRQLKALRAEQAQMRAGPVRFIGAQAEGNDAEILFAGRTQTLRPRKASTMPPLVKTENSHKKSKNICTPARPAPTKPPQVQEATKSFEANDYIETTEAPVTVTSVSAKQPRDESVADNKQGSAKKKRRMEDLSSDLGDSWEPLYGHDGHRLSRSAHK
ncbi:hypothetical protein Micbo1qcDRAFT_179649 [Microdochium bolleyi]|uniref:Uncharacterized protein n=1 Tax=Microdochium bolleyi TaxID=196109 RepID=A0A136IP26_9PEZI|nr:hypothetical protein Micbo1qcDRAFT_179649 [Microdochium bolleyi]